MTRYVLLAALLAVSFASFAQVQTQVVGDTVYIKTDTQQRLSVWKNGTVNIAPNNYTTQPLFRVYPNGDITAGADNRYITDQFKNKNGLRFNKKLGILEVGISNNIDTTLNVAGDHFQPSALVVNSDSSNVFTGKMISSIIAGDYIRVLSPGSLAWSIVTGEQHTITGSLYKSNMFGYGHTITNPDSIAVIGSAIMGISNRLDSANGATVITGLSNRDSGYTIASFISGRGNRFGGHAQFVSGAGLIAIGYASTTLGSGNVDFASLPRIRNPNPQPNLKAYPLLAIGNSGDWVANRRSNAFTMLYNGRTQINTTGYDSSLSESQVTPKAALEVVSTTSGVLLPKLTTTQRNAIVSGDKHNGLLLYNTDSTKFQFYDGSAWRSLSDNSSGQGVNKAVQTLTDGSTITWNANSGLNSTVTLHGNRSLTISNPIAGYIYRIRIKQDSTGSRTITHWPDSTLWPTGTPPTLSTTGNAVDLVTFYYDGTYFYGDYKLLYQATANVSIIHTDALADHEEVTHTLTGVPPGALLVITTGCESSMLDASISSSPSLMWGSPRSEAEAVNSGDAEIYTAVFPTGGSINITVNWGDNYMSSVCYTVINQEADEDGEDAHATGQAAPSVNILTTREHSILFCVSADFSAKDGATRQYRNTPTEGLYNYDVGRGTQYHYYKLAPNVTTYTVGLTDPNDMEAGTAVFEVRSR